MNKIVGLFFVVVVCAQATRPLVLLLFSLECRRMCRGSARHVCVELWDPRGREAQLSILSLASIFPFPSLFM